MEEVELRPEATMVPLAGVLELLQVRVQVGLVEEGRPVDPRQLLVPLVAAPVRAGEARELERLDRLGILQVRPAAEVGEIALRIEVDVAVGRVDELELVRLLLGLEAEPRLLARDALAAPLPPLGDLVADLVLDPLERLLPDRLGELEVVVEAALDRRPDRDLHAGVEAADRLGQQVRRRMAQDVKGVGVVLVSRRQDLDLLAVLERQAKVLYVSVRADQNRLLGELRADRGSGVEARSAVGKFKLGRVGKDDLHGRSGYFGRFPQHQRFRSFTADGRTGRARTS
jgi:hypothetical protein